MRYTPIAGAMAASLLGLVQPALAGGFVEDSKATLDTRNFYINQDNRSGDAAPSYAEEWGQGFLLNFQSGYTDGPVGVGLDALAQLGIRLDSGGRTTKAGRSRNPGSVFSKSVAAGARSPPGWPPPARAPPPKPTWAVVPPGNG